jgi:hypothetical protein
MANILADRDANTTMHAQPDQKENMKPKSMEYHRQVLESRLKDGK